MQAAETFGNFRGAISSAHDKDPNELLKRPYVVWVCRSRRHAWEQRLLAANQKGQIPEAFPRALPAVESCTSISLPSRPCIATLLPNQSALKNPSRRDLFCQGSDSPARLASPAALKQDEDHEHI